MATNRVYVLSLESPVAPTALRRLLGEMAGIHSWILSLPSSVILLSDKSAHDLAESIGPLLDGTPFLITEVAPNNYGGLLAPESWDFLNHPEAIGAEPDVSRLVSSRIIQSLRASDLYDKPAFTLAAMPLDAVSVPTIFAAQNSEIAVLLANPPALRPHGFDMRTAQQPENINGQLLRAALPQWKCLEFWRDGLLSFAADGQDDFLCWAQRERNPNRPLRINPLVLVESVLTFAILSIRLREYIEPTPLKVQYALTFFNMKHGTTNCLLAPGELGPYDWHGDEAKVAPSDSKTFYVTWRGGDLDPEEVAFSLVSSVYEWFGFTHQEIPYSHLEEGGRGRVSVQLIESASKKS